MNQDIAIGVQPDKDGTSPKTVMPLAYLYYTRPVWVEEPDTASFKYVFISDEYGQKDVRKDYAFGTRADDGTLTPVFMGNPADSIVKDRVIKSCYVKVDSTVFQPGEWMTLYPMMRFRNIPDSDWQMLGSEKYRVIAGRTDDGPFFLFCEMSDLEITKVEITRGPGRMGMGNGLALTVRNKSDRESTMPLYLVPYYYGKVKPEDVTADTPRSEGDAMKVGAYLRANQDTEITYCFKPLASGTVGLKLALPDGTPLANCFIEVSDTIGSYKDYLVNQSTYELLPRQVAYHICIADNPEANIPQGVPSDNIYFYAGIFDENNEVVQSIKLTEEIIDYLKALPEKAGDGNYTLTAELIADIPRSGYYYVWSYLNEWMDDGTYIDGGDQYEVFYFELDATGIVSVTRVDKDDSRYVNLNGINSNTRPARKGIYIHQGRKVIVSGKKSSFP